MKNANETTKTTKNPQSRGWMLTLPAEDYSQEYVEQKLSNYNYLGQLESGEKTGYVHWQVYMEAKNPVKFSTLKNAFPTGHMEKRKGTVAQAITYVTKTVTSLGKTISQGSFEKASERETTAKESALAYYVSLLDDGMPLTELLSEKPKALRFVRALSEYETVKREVEFGQELRDVKAHYIWGKTGVGKTYSLVKQHRGEMYRVSNYKNPFDGYNYEPVVVLDEFYSENISFDYLLNLLDDYPLRLRARYNDKLAVYDTIYIVSNVPLEKQYPEVQEKNPEAWQALLRRIDSVSEFTIKDRD